MQNFMEETTHKEFRVIIDVYFDQIKHSQTFPYVTYTQFEELCHRYGLNEDMKGSLKDEYYEA